MQEDKGITRYRKEIDQYSQMFLITQLSEDPEVRLSGQVANFLVEFKEWVVEAYEKGEPFVANNYGTAPEVCAAMDLPWYMIYENIVMASIAEDRGEEIDATLEMGLGTDLCTAVRSSIYYVENDLVPLPSGIVGFLAPCDGMPMVHQVIQQNERWGRVPMFSPDPPYFDNDDGIDYFAHEIRKTVSFLEEVAGRRLDLDRLKEVIEEGNRQYLLWQEYNELRRAKPCPHGYSVGGPTCFGVAGVLAVGQEKGTRWFQDMVEVTEKKVSEGRGAVETEKVRLFWFDLMPTGWIFEFLPWLEEEFGAVVVMDMFGNHPYSTIDTSSEKEIWRGLAKRGMFDTPMIRQAIGPAQGFVNDLTRIVKDYEIDVVVWPGHMGHKEYQATFGIIRETCREAGVRFLDLRMDMFDNRYTTADEIKVKFARFFGGIGLG